MKINKHPTLLIVDDNPESLKLMINTLIESKLDINFITAVNGKLALQIAKEEIPDIILMDWEMPEMNGIEAVVEIKKTNTLKHIPIIITSGVMLSTNDLKLALDAGASDYIRKPFEKTELVARVNAQLNFGQSLKTIITQNQTLKKQEAELKNMVEELKEINSINENLLTCTALQIGHCNSTLKNIHGELKNTVKNLSDTPKTHQKILFITNSIKSELQTNTWKNFEQRFLLSNPKFFDSLKLNFPILTSNDLRFCAFIALNISYKDIALILNISPESVKTNRKRLRKKLNLLPNDDLSTLLYSYKK